MSTTQFPKPRNHMDHNHPMCIKRTFFVPKPWLKSNFTNTLSLNGWSMINTIETEPLVYIVYCQIEYCCVPL